MAKIEFRKCSPCVPYLFVALPHSFQLFDFIPNNSHSLGQHSNELDVALTHFNYFNYFI